MLGLGLPAAAQRGGRGSTVPDVWPLQEGEREEFWQNFRELRPAATYSFEFELRHMPRRGDGPSFEGVLWGGVTNRGTVIRIVLRPEGKPDETVEYLILNAREPEMWRWTAEGGLEAIDSTDAFVPLMEGILFSPFDLAMPFLYWDDYQYLRSERVRGRGAHVFSLRPPTDEAAGNYPTIGYVEVAVDSQFDALLRVQVHQPDSALARSMNMLNFRRAGDHWIVRSMDLIDEQSRDKTRFTINAVAFDVPLSITDFEPRSLGGNRPVVDSDKVIRF